MAFVVTKVRAYGVESEEAVNKRYKQNLILNITGLNSDVDMDLGDAVSGSLGTFWTSADDTATGLVALSIIRDIAVRAESFIGLGATSLVAYVQADASVPVVSQLTSAASSGGNATETLTVTGLLTTDTILGATIVEDGGTPAYIQEAAKTCAVAGQYIVTFSADPGAGAEVMVVFSRATTAVQSGTYQVVAGALAQLPNILFLSGNAPTSYVLELQWILKDQEAPVEGYATA